MSEAAKRFYASPPGEDADAAADYSWELELERQAEAAGVATAYASQSTPWWAEEYDHARREPDVTPELGHEPPQEDRHHLFIGGDECERCAAHITAMGQAGCPGYMEPTG